MTAIRVDAVAWAMKYFTVAAGSCLVSGDVISGINEIKLSSKPIHIDIHVVADIVIRVPRISEHEKKINDGKDDIIREERSRTTQYSS